LSESQSPLGRMAVTAYQDGIQWCGRTSEPIAAQAKAPKGETNEAPIPGSIAAQARPTAPKTARDVKNAPRARERKAA
jgi:hypothetical protein